MFGILFRKQMTELFKSYFFNRKTGKLRPKNQIIMFIILFIGILVMIANSFSPMVKMLASSLLPAGQGILYFELLGAFSLAFGLFGSTILASRMASSYLMSIIYEAVLYIPAVIQYGRYSGAGAPGMIFPCLNLFISGFAVLALTCLFGWLMAAASSRIRNRNYFITAASLLAVGLYYAVMFRVNDLVNLVLKNPDRIAGNIRRFAYPLYLFGSGSCGNTLHFLLFIAIITIVFFITAAAMSVSFIKLATANRGLKKKGFRADSVKASGRKTALLRKERGRFFNTPILFLNSGLGLLISPAAAIAALVKSSSLNQALSAIPSKEMIPGIVLTAVCFICSIGEMTASSISLEGKSLWILRTMPVKTSEILRAKIRFAFTATLPSAVISLILFSAAFRISPVTAALMIIAAAANILLVTSLGLVFNLKRPNLEWTSEMVPVKQDAPLIFSMLAGIALSAIPAVLGAAMMHLPSAISVSACAVIFAVAVIPVNKWINTKGTELFEDI